MGSLLNKLLFTLVVAFLMSSCGTLSAPDDASFAMVAVFPVAVPPQGPFDDATRQEMLDTYDKNLRKQFNGSLQDNWVNSLLWVESGPRERLRYIFIREHRVNLDKFNTALTDTWSAKPTPPNPFLIMSITPAPVSGPDCSSHVCSPLPCTCITYSPCASGCKKKGTATCCP
jgi:hypothetical protein